MTPEKIQKQYGAVCDSVGQKNVKDALIVLAELVKETQSGNLVDDLYQLENTYRNILKYTIEGADDPERGRVYDRLMISILEVADEARVELMEKFSGWQTFRLRAEHRGKQAATGNNRPEKLEELFFAPLYERYIKKASAAGKDGTAEKPGRKDLVRTFFIHIWLMEKMTEADKELLKEILDSGEFTWPERSVLVSALSLSLLHFFDEEKMHRLFAFFEARERQVSERALVGLIINFYFYDNRIAFYKELTDRIKLMGDDREIQEHIEHILLQIIRSKDTEQISRKLRDEIIPEMAKLGPKLEDKLDLKNLVKDEGSEEKNPDWEDIFEDSESLYEKVEEFSKLQMEGADVFMSTFAQLKNFEFFNDMMHWFLPFYPENTEVEHSLESLEDETSVSTLVDGLFRLPFLNNSDKYSFVLNVKHIPSQQKKMLVQLFKAEMDALKEQMNEDEIVKPTEPSRFIYVQYIQDLYRFMKLFPFRQEFPDIFVGRLAIYDAYFFKTLIVNPGIQRKIAEYLFSKNHFEDALDLYLHLDEHQERSYEIIEKIAFCCQQLGNYRKALEYYKMADLFDKRSPWVLRKIAYCYRKLQQPGEAVKYYEELEKMDPDDLFVQARIGQCYLDLEDYDEALKHYFRVEYQDPSNDRVLRPIAWCYFVLGKMDDAEKYYNKILKAKPNAYDYQNAGHVQWVKGHRKVAVDLYRQSVRAQKNFSLFMKGFENDKKYLLQYGVEKQEIPIVLDYLRYLVEQERRG